MSFGEMSFRQDVLSAQCLSARCLSARCLSARCPSTLALAFVPVRNVRLAWLRGGARTPPLGGHLGGTNHFQWGTKFFFVQITRQ